MQHRSTIDLRRVAGWLLAAACLVCTACASSTPPARPGPVAAGSPASDGDRLGGARSVETIFTPPLLPPPTDARLATGAPGPAYWQNRCDYAIDAALDAEARRVTGRARVAYVNNSPHTLEHVWLLLEQNLFDPGSEGARLTIPNARYGNRHAFRGGFEDLRVVTPEGQTGLAVYETVARLDVPGGLGPGARYEFTVEWAFQVPPYGSDRMGVDEVRDGPIFQIAQWFPAVAKYDDVNGWNTLPYLGQGEFYTDFGDFDVRLTVPRDHIVAATGTLRNAEAVLTSAQVDRLERARGSAETVAIRPTDEIGPESRPEGQGPLTWEFRAEGVRTFAWASSAAFAWDGCAARVEQDGSGPRAVLCQSFYPREAPAWKDSSQMVRESVEHYSRRWFPYPYPAASNVNGVVGGMEYPGIVFCGGRDDERELWDVTTHEVSHTWFPMLVSTDERRHAWMDEGFTTFLNHYASLEHYLGESAALGDEGVDARRDAAEFAALRQPIDTPADQLFEGTLGASQYAKAATGLVILRESVLGPERFDEAFRAYIRRWAFKSPRPADFFRTMQDVSGMELGWFWRGWFGETGALDQAVTTVMQPSGAESRNARVTFENRGSLVMPLKYRVTYEDGSEETRVLPVQAWFQGDTWQTTWDTGGRKVRAVLVDPGEELPDVDPRNNRWPR